MPTKKKTQTTQTGRNIFEGTAYECAHRISFWYDLRDVVLTDEIAVLLTAEAEDHSKTCIIDDYVEGELHCTIDAELEIDLSGWWKIDRDYRG